MLIQEKKQVKFTFELFHFLREEDRIVDIQIDLPNNSINDLDVYEIQNNLEKKLRLKRTQKKEKNLLGQYPCKSSDVQAILYNDFEERGWVIEEVEMFTRDSDESDWIPYDETADINGWGLDKT